MAGDPLSVGTGLLVCARSGVVEFVNIPEGTPLSKAHEMMSELRIDPDSIAAFDRVTKARHSSRHPVSGKFLPAVQHHGAPLPVTDGNRHPAVLPGSPLLRALARES